MLTHYLQLGKFRLSLLVLFTCAIGYLLGLQTFNLTTFFSLLLGTLFCAMGANGLNQWWEREHDAKMLRTRRRPIPTGKISANNALWMSSLCCVGGYLLLFLAVEPLTALLAAITIGVYILLYTPLKRVSPIAVLVGAIPGAIPPVMGWAAATAELSSQAWVLFCLLYLWQIPHFMSLATLYHHDYVKGGYRMVPDDPLRETSTRSIILVFCLALLGITLLTPYAGLGQWLFFVGAVIGGLTMLGLALRFYQSYSIRNARNLFVGSILYLPLVLSLLLYDHKVMFAS